MRESSRERGRYRLCSLLFHPLCEDRGLLLIETRQGARHMIRSLLASVGSSGSGRSTTCLAGDLRYGASRPLPDGSVALHARHLEIFPCETVGTTRERRSGGRTNPTPLLHKLGGVYVAPVPDLWEECFGITEWNVSDALLRAARTSLLRSKEPSVVLKKEH